MTQAGMGKNSFLKKQLANMENDRRRRKREYVFIVLIAVAFALLTYIEHRSINFGGDIPVSSTILMFILTNLNLLLLLLLTFLVFRNLVKLLYERKRKVMGARLKTRLVVAFITLTLMPAISTVMRI